MHLFLFVACRPVNEWAFPPLLVAAEAGGCCWMRGSFSICYRQSQEVVVSPSLESAVRPSQVNHSKQIRNTKPPFLSPSQEGNKGSILPSKPRSAVRLRRSSILQLLTLTVMMCLVELHTMLVTPHFTHRDTEDRGEWLLRSYTVHPPQ